jgi:uncharacterized protein YjhX (UPF0386 family)
MRTGGVWYLFLAIASMAAGPLTAEERTSKVQVEGLEDIRAQLQRIDSRLSLLTNSGWEYMFVQRNRFDGNIKRELESLGRDGWELVNVTLEEGFILKRRLLR